VAALALLTVLSLTGMTVANATAADAAKRKIKKVAVLVAGDRNDGGFYQGQVDALKKSAKKNHYKLIVIDKVGIGTSTEAFENAGRQKPDIIISTGQELQDGFNAVCEDPQFQGIFFLGIAAFPPQCKGAAHAIADDYQAHYLAGVAAAEILKATGHPGGIVATVAGPQLNFVTDDNDAFKEGLKATDPNATFKIVFTGDFENAALASEAAKAQIDQGANLLYPYLGGALIAVVEAANQAGVPVLATSIDGCGIPPPGPQFAGSVLFNPAPFYADLVSRYIKGKLKAGQFLVYHIDWPGLGANICKATPEQQKVLDNVRKKLINGQIKVSNTPFKESKTKK